MRITTVLVPLLLMGCSSGLDSETALRKHGYSEAYVAGYHDGCPSGEKAGGAFLSEERRDEGAYLEGGDYKTGWDYGFVTCAERERNELAWANAIGSGIAATGSSSHGADGIDAQKMLDGIDTSGISAAGW